LFRYIGYVLALDPLLLWALIPIKSYSNADTEKAKILFENKNKAGVYLWTNLNNGKRYIGSSENLARRFREYFNTNYLLKKTNMYICNSLFKHGYSNFSLTILEYCEPEMCLIREKYFWDLLNPEYNIAKDPNAPFSGRKHSPESIKKMSDANKGENHPNFGKTGDQNSMFGKKHSDETRQKLSDANKGENNPNFGKPKAEGAGKSSQAIEVVDQKTNETTTYDSISEAARVLNIPQAVISMYFANNQQKPYKKQYIFKKVCASGLPVSRCPKEGTDI